MTSNFTGQIVLFAGSYAPEGFLPCDGRELAINQYEPLYSLIGITYGGDGRTVFNLPDLRSRIPLGRGQGFVDPKNAAGGNLSTYVLGQKGGSETVSLTQAQIPAHTHALRASNVDATTNDPSGMLLANVPAATAFYCYDTPGGPTPTTMPMGAQAITSTGGSTAHANEMPVLPLTYIICVNGIYPSMQ